MPDGTVTNFALYKVLEFCVLLCSRMLFCLICADYMTQLGHVSCAFFCASIHFCAVVQFLGPKPKEGHCPDKSRKSLVTKFRCQSRRKKIVVKLAAAEMGSWGVVVMGWPHTCMSQVCLRPSWKKTLLLLLIRSLGGGLGFSRDHILWGCWR